MAFSVVALMGILTHPAHDPDIIAVEHVHEEFAEPLASVD
jgi:hypothetical protein